MRERESLGAVGATALTPLYAKAHAERLVPATGFRDPLAAEVLARVEYDPAQVLTDHGNVAGAVYRSQAIDRVALGFVDAHPDARLLSVGIGLCTRHGRLAGRLPGSVTLAGLDTDDVIALRRRVIPGDPVELTSGSITTPGWSAPLAGGLPTLVIAEGVLMYLDDAGLATFLTGVRDQFGPGTELVGDYFHPVVATSDRHPIVKATGARFRSGARNTRALARIAPGFAAVAEYPVMERIGAAQRVAARLFTAITAGGRLYAVAHLRVIGPPAPPDRAAGADT